LRWVDCGRGEGCGVRDAREHHCAGGGLPVARFGRVSAFSWLPSFRMSRVSR
jgi:hypothetical protein